MQTELPSTSEKTLVRTASAQAIFQEQQLKIHRTTDQMFAGLMIFQWLAGIGAAIWISPLTWIGTRSEVNLHLWAAIFLGGLITWFPVILAWKFPGKTVTRLTVSVGQALTSCLLIHLTGGRIETHFHIFGSLAFLAFYKDWRVIVTASTVIAVDHFLRGVYWPQSVFGVLEANSWRWIEHSAWVAFEDTFLLFAIHLRLKEGFQNAIRQVEVEEKRVQAWEREIKVQELFNQNLQLEATSRAKSEFVAHMSHELRTPLNGIIGFSEILTAGFAGEVNSEQKDFLEEITTSGKHLLHLVNEILDLAKMEAGKMEFYPEAVNLPELLKEISSSFVPILREKDLTLRTTIAPILTEVMVDRQKLKQTLLNLLANACKFNQDHGQIEIHCAGLDGTHFTVAVRDTGIGIKPEDLGKLFHDFSQVESGATRQYQGSGLGLVLAQRMVQLQGGEIRVESEYQKGTTFTLTLPLKSPTTRLLRERAKREAKRTKRRQPRKVDGETISSKFAPTSIAVPLR